jgi:hypothetical protein
MLVKMIAKYALIVVIIFAVYKYWPAIFAFAGGFLEGFTGN